MSLRSIRRFWAVIYTLLVIEVIVGLAIWQWPHLFTSRYVSDLYRTYADQPGIDATFLHNFPLNDTLRVDVTLLQATDSSGWERLKKDFEIVEITPEERQAMGEKVYKRVCRSSVRLSPKEHPGAPMDKTDISNNLVLGISREKCTIGVFHTNTEDEIHAVNIYKYKKNTTENEENR